MQQVQSFFSRGKKTASPDKKSSKSNNNANSQQHDSNSDNANSATFFAASPTTAAAASSTKKRHLPDITKVQVTSRDPLTQKELKQDLQRLVNAIAINSRVMKLTIESIVSTATSVSRQQDLYRLLSRGERDLAAVLGTEEKPTPTTEPSADNMRLWASTLVAFVATEHHSKLAASYLGVAKQSVAATTAELDSELEWFFLRFDPRHVHFAKTIASHFNGNVAMQVGLARFLFQDLLWVVLGVSVDEDTHFPYLHTVDAGLGVGSVKRLHESYLKVVVWNHERNEVVRKATQDSVLGDKSGNNNNNTENSEEQENKNDNDDDHRQGIEAEPQKQDNNANKNNLSITSSPINNNSVTAMMTPSSMSSANSEKNASLLWNPQATAAIILVAEFALRPQKQVASNVYASVPPLYRDTFGWLAQPWLEIPLDFKRFPKPFILFDLWALDTVHKFGEYRQFCIEQLHSFLLEESGAFNVIEDARRSSEQVLRRKASIQFIVVRRAIEMLVATEQEHRTALERKRSSFLQEGKLAMAYAAEYREIRSSNMFMSVNSNFQHKFHAMKLIIEENAREVQRIGRAVGEKQRLQIEAAKRQEQMKMSAGKNQFRNNNNSNNSPSNKNSNNQRDDDFHSAMALRNEKASAFLKSSQSMKKILADERQHRSHVIHTLGEMDDQERDLTFRVRRDTHAVEKNLESVGVQVPRYYDNTTKDNFEGDEASLGNVSAINNNTHNNNAGSPSFDFLARNHEGVSEMDLMQLIDTSENTNTNKNKLMRHVPNHNQKQNHLNDDERNPSRNQNNNNSENVTKMISRFPIHEKDDRSKKIVFDDEDLREYLYSHHYHINNDPSNLQHFSHQRRALSASPSSSSSPRSNKKELQNQNQNSTDRFSHNNNNNDQSRDLQKENPHHHENALAASMQRRRAPSILFASSMNPGNLDFINNPHNADSPTIRSRIMNHSAGSHVAAFQHLGSCSSFVGTSINPNSQLLNASAILFSPSSPSSPHGVHYTSSSETANYQTQTQQRSQREAEKLKLKQQRAVTPTLWNSERASRVSRAGAPGNHTNDKMAKDRAAQRKRELATYRSRLNMTGRSVVSGSNAAASGAHHQQQQQPLAPSVQKVLRARTPTIGGNYSSSTSSSLSLGKVNQLQQREKLLLSLPSNDHNNNKNDDVLQEMEDDPDGSQRLQNLKKTENFRHLRGQFFHVLYGRLYEAMGVDGL